MAKLQRHKKQQQPNSDTLAFYCHTNGSTLEAKRNRITNEFSCHWQNLTFLKWSSRMTQINAYSIIVLLKEWSMDRKYQYYLEAY